MAERYYYYYDAADFRACEDHMRDALEKRYPQVEGMGIEEAIAALEDSGDLHQRNFKRLGARMGPDGSACMALH